MPVEKINLFTGSQFHRIACDRPPCRNAVTFSAGKTREQAIGAARGDGYVVAGKEGAETVVCPDCAKATTTLLGEVAHIS
jgi:hypothetical protein